MDSSASTDNRHCEICGALLRRDREWYYDFNGRRRTDTYLRCPTHGTRPDSAKRIRSISAEMAAETRAHNRWNPRPYSGSSYEAMFDDSYRPRIGVLLLFALPVAGFLAAVASVAGFFPPGLPRVLVATAVAFVAWLGAVGIYGLLERPFKRKWDESERRRVEYNEREREKRRERGQRSYSGLTESRWKDLLREFDHRCAYCSAPLVPGQTHRDHFVPFAEGGADDVSNIVPACIECNKAKRDQMPKVWLARCRREKKRVNPKLKEWQLGRTATD